jgi:hypothetical protein
MRGRGVALRRNGRDPVYGVRLKAASTEDIQAILSALQGSLVEAGYADAADQVRRVMNEPLQADDLDDQLTRRRSRARFVLHSGMTMRSAAQYGKQPMMMMKLRSLSIEPSMTRRLTIGCTAIKVVDLMVTEPLRIEGALPAIWRRSELDITEVRVGEGTAALVLPRQPNGGSMEALDAWTVVLAELRATLDDAEAGDR